MIGLLKSVGCKSGRVSLMTEKHKTKSSRARFCPRTQQNTHFRSLLPSLVCYKRQYFNDYRHKGGRSRAGIVGLAQNEMAGEEAVFAKVQDLRPCTTGHNLHLKVCVLLCVCPLRVCAECAHSDGLPVAVDPSRSFATHTQVVEAAVVVDRPKGTRGGPTRVAECIVGDETGTIVLSAKNEQSAFVAVGVSGSRWCICCLSPCLGWLLVRRPAQNARARARS